MIKSKYTQNHFAFSLIELMVVIAIVAILAVTSVPLYKQYMTNAHMSKFSNLGWSILDDGMQRANLGDTTTYNVSMGDDPNGFLPDTMAFGPEVSGLSYFPRTDAGCLDAGGELDVYVTGPTEYFPNMSSGGIYYNWFHIDGIITKGCWYEFVDSNNEPISGNIINGCTNWYNADGSMDNSFWDIIATMNCP